MSTVFQGAERDWALEWFASPIEQQETSAAGSDLPVNPGSPDVGSGGQAQSLLETLPYVLPPAVTQEGHVTTSDQAAVDQLTSFLALIPGAEDLVSAIKTGSITSEQYAQVEQLLLEQAGLDSSPSPSEAPDPATAAAAEQASAFLNDREQLFVPNPTPAEDGYRFNLDGPQGEVIKAWLSRSEGGIVDQPGGSDDGVELGSSGDEGWGEWVFDKIMNGEVLSQMEYDQVCAAIYHEACGRNRGEGDSEVSQRLGKEVLAGDETTGYLWEEDKKLYWTDADGNTSEIGESGWDTSGFVRAGTHEEFYGAYSIPPEKREPLAALIESSDDFEGKQALIEAIRAGHLDASQHFLVMERLDIMANNGMATDTFESVDDLLAVWDSSN